MEPVWFPEVEGVESSLDWKRSRDAGNSGRVVVRSSVDDRRSIATMMSSCGSVVMGTSSDQLPDAEDTAPLGSCLGGAGAT